MFERHLLFHYPALKDYHVTTWVAGLHEMLTDKCYTLGKIIHFDVKAMLTFAPFATLCFTVQIHQRRRTLDLGIPYLGHHDPICQSSETPGQSPRSFRSATEKKFHCPDYSDNEVTKWSCEMPTHGDHERLCRHSISIQPTIENHQPGQRWWTYWVNYDFSLQSGIHQATFYTPFPSPLSPFFVHFSLILWSLCLSTTMPHAARHCPFS